MSEIIPPHSIEIEQSLLGSLLMYPDAFHLSEGLRSEHFFEPLHQAIFEVISTLSNQGKTVDALLVQQFLPKNAEVAGMTVRQYVTRLVSVAEIIGTVKDYAAKVRDYADRREIMRVVDELSTMQVDEAVDMAAHGIERLDAIVADRSNATVNAVTLDESMVRAVDAAAVAYQNEGKMLGIPFGLRELDKKTLGAQEGNLIILAGRPGMGKTALAVSLARNMGIAGHPGVIYSLEMVDTELSQRMIADEMYDDGRFFYSMIRSGKFAESVFLRIREAASNLEKLPIKIEQQPSLTVAQIVSRARQLKRRGKLKWMMVDHLGLVKPSNRYQGNKVYEIGEITGTLKAAAKELGIPIILLCQLSRTVETRDDKRPQLSDLRSSGDIEQDADVVMFLYREAYYLDRKEPPQGSTEWNIWESEMRACETKMEVEIAKQRSGPTGRITLKCDIGANAIRNWEGDFS